MNAGVADDGAVDGRVVDPLLRDWCRRWLGASPAAVAFAGGNLSRVVGLHLDDGQAVAVKIRPPHPRLRGCATVQEHLWRRGYPCPEPLAGPEPLGERAATAERLVPGGEPLADPGSHAGRFAAALADLIGLAPALAAVPDLSPPPPWVRWDHAQAGVWPRPLSSPDLNANLTPVWLDDVAARVRALLRRHGDGARPVVGHADFESQNMRWTGDRLHVVHDWDSVAGRPEAVLVGAAAAAFPATGATAVAATVQQSAAFVDHYEAARGRSLSAADRAAAWAAGLWVLAYNAAVECVEGGGPLLGCVADQVAERMRRAGL